MERTSVSSIFWGFIFILGGAFNAVAQVSTPPENIILDKGAGWIKVQQRPSAGVNTATQNDQQVLMIDSYQGLEASPLPSSIKAMLSDEFASSSSPNQDGTDNILIVDLDVAKAISNGTAEQLYAAYLEPDEDSSQFSSQVFSCSTGWRRRNFSPIEKSFDQTFDIGKSFGGVALRTDMQVEGDATFIVGYKYKKTSFCLPWVATLTQTQVSGAVEFVNSNLNSDIALVGAVTQKNRKVMRTLFDFSQTFMIGPLPVHVGITMPWGVGLDITTELSANAHFDLPVNGGFWFDYTCGFKDGCQPTNQEVGGSGSNLSFGNGESLSWEQLDVGYSASAKLSLRPYAFTELQAYLYHPSMASLSFGIEAGVPLNLGLIGGMCGDTNNHDVPDYALAAYADLNAELALYWGYQLLLDEQTRHPINWPISQSVGGWHKYLVDWQVDAARADEPFYAYRKHLFFAGSGDLAFTPMIIGPSNVDRGRTESYVTSTRPCYPFNDAALLKITYPDGTVENTTENHDTGSVRRSGGKQFSVEFDEDGDQTIMVEHLGDIMGRDFSLSLQNYQKRSEFAVHINPNVPPAFTGGHLGVSNTPSSKCFVPSACYFQFTSIPTTDGSEESIVFQSKYAPLNGSYGDWKIFTPVSFQMTPNAPKYAKINHNFSSDGIGTHYFRMKACNQNGCTPWSYSNVIEFNTPQDIPTLSYSAFGCTLEIASWNSINGANNYQLKSSTSAAMPLTKLEYEGPATYKVKNFTDNRYLAVRACNDIGCSGYSARKKAMPVCQ